MKLICKCGNIEDVKTDNIMGYFEIRNCKGGTIALVCKKCNETILIKSKNN